VNENDIADQLCADIAVPKPDNEYGSAINQTHRWFHTRVTDALPIRDVWQAVRLEEGQPSITMRFRDWGTK